MNPENLFLMFTVYPWIWSWSGSPVTLDFKIQRSFSILFLISSIWWLITPSTSKCILFKIHIGFSSNFTSHSSLLVSSQLAHPYFSDLQGVPRGSVFLPLLYQYSPLSQSNSVSFHTIETLLMPKFVSPAHTVHLYSRSIHIHFLRKFSMCTSNRHLNFIMS